MTPRIASCIVVILVSATVFCQEPAANVQEADQLFAKGNYTQALTIYDRALQQQPKLFEALVGKGRSLLRLGKGMEALDACNEAVNQRMAAQSLRCRAEIYEKLGSEKTTRADWQQAAIADWRGALRLDPALREAHLSMAALYWKSGLKSEGIEELKIFVAGDPRNADSRYQLALWLHESGQYTEALAQWNEVLKINPARTDALRKRMEYYVSQGDRVNALADLKQLLKDTPDDAAGYRKQAEFHAALGNLPDAFREARKAAALTASAAEKKQWKEDGVQYLMTWLTAERDDAKRLLMMDSLDAATKTELAPHLAELRYISLRRVGRDEQAMRVVEEALTHGRGNAGMFHFAAERVSRSQTEPRKVIALSRKGLQVAQEKDQDAKRDLHYLMGAAYMQLMQYPEANTALRAAAAYPGQVAWRANLYLLLGYANYQMRRAQDALQFYTEALRISGPHQAQVTKNIAAVKAEFQIQ